MATQTQRKQYRDLDAGFRFNPLTDDLGILRDHKAIAFSVKNLILTMNGERPFDRSVGTPVKHLLFELHGMMLEIVLKKLIEDTLRLHEPRITVVDISVKQNVDSHSVAIDIKYMIINTTTPYEVSVVLERTR